MKKRNIVLLVVGAIVLAVVVFAVFAMQTDEGKAGYWEARLGGIWSAENEDGSVFSIVFSDDSITFSEDGEEILSGSFTADDDVIKVYIQGSLRVFPFELDGKTLQIELGDESIYLRKE